MRIWLNVLSRNGMRVTPSTDWSVFELIVQAAASNGDVVRFLDEFDQGFEHLQELVFVVETRTPRISSTVVCDKQEVFCAVKAFDWVRSPNFNMHHLSRFSCVSLGRVSWYLYQSPCDYTHWAHSF